MEIKLKLNQNSRNKQFNLVLSKNQFPQLKKGIPKFMRIRGELEFLE